MCERWVCSVLLAALAMLAIVPAAQGQQVENLVLNNSFEEDEDIQDDGAYEGWWTWNPAEGAGSVATVDETEAIDGVRSIRVDPRGTANWHFIVAYSTLSMDMSKDYTVSFWAKAAEPRSLTVAMKAADNSVNAWGATDFELTTEWAEYTYTSNVLHTGVKLEIWTAASDIPLWLDFVNIYEGEYVAGIQPSGLQTQVKAADPTPRGGASDVPQDVLLGWSPGEFATTHDVYFGTAFDDVEAAGRSNPIGVLVSEGQTGTSFDAGRLEFGQTYYWRVDEVNAAPDSAIHKGDVWSFTVEPLAYALGNVTATTNGSSDVGAGPENTINGSGLNANDEHSTAAPDMWLATPGAELLWIQYEFDKIYKLHEMLIWNYNVQFEPVLGFGLKDVTLEYSANGEDWVVAGDVEIARATASVDYAANTKIDFSGVSAQYVRLTVNSGWGPMGQFGLSEVRFMYIPTRAREPQPADGATGVAVDATLDWRVGRDVVSHDVYLSTDETAVADQTALVGTVAEKGYEPGALDFGSTYYWRIDEIQETELWVGDIWSFSTVEYAVIDDMEGYNDDENAIFDTWLDGFVNGSGSTVGYFEAPFAERSIVHSGRQSMPLQYDNSAAPFYSEAEYDLGGIDLNSNGADTLRVFVAGQAPAFLEEADGTVFTNGIGTDIWGVTDEFRYAYKSLSGNGSMVARVDDLDETPDIWVKAGVMVRQSTDPASAHSMMILTGGGGNGASWQGRPSSNASSENEDATAAVTPPYWVKVERTGNDLAGFVSADGETWVQVGTVRTVVMTDPVLIGLALTSHNASRATSAEFSNVSTTGNVTGDWQVAEIGVAQPTGNELSPLYVALEDGAGNVAVATNPDAAAVGRSGWTEWLIPYSDLPGISLSNVSIMFIGVGNRDNPTTGGAGLIFVDDIGYGRPATVE